MNNVRRKRINVVIGKLETFEEGDKLDEIVSEVEDILMEEEMAFDNMPESLQWSMRGMDMEDAIDNLTEAVECLEDDDVDGAIGALEMIM